MRKHFYTQKIALAVVLAFSTVACDDDDETPNLRAKIDYNVISADVPYSTLFVDADGNTTVDLTEGNQLHKMFQALNYYSTSSVAANASIDAAKLKKMFANTENPFFDISTNTISVTGAELNAADVQLKSLVASSRPGAEAEAVRTKIESYFDQIATASLSVNGAAGIGQAGKLGTYLVDEKGIEIAQVIQKSLIGALQLDYIGNVLLDEGLTANNHTVVGDHNYTQLEHNWDVAYGLLTLNPIYLQGATSTTRPTVEFGAGSYIWEYNKEDYASVYPAFLKGRAAIVNNDRAELEAQALFIRTAFEKALANAATGYLAKWKSTDANATDASRAHAIAEGLGFIYSLRFATAHNVDAAFSDAILNDLIGSPNGFWDLTTAKVTAASDAIKAKFGL